MKNENTLDERVIKLEKKVKSFNTRNKKLRKLLDVTKSIMAETDINKLINLLLRKTAEVVKADRSTLFLIDRKNNDVYSRVFIGDEVKEIRFPMGRGIAGYVAKTGEIVNISDVYNDPRFNQDVDKKTGYTTKSLLTMPIKNLEGKIVGVTQVLNKKGYNRFTKEDIQLLTAFSSLIAISIENALNVEQIKKTMHAFEYFVPPKYLKRILKDGIENIHLGQGERCELTILFLDIRDFTTLSENMTSDDIAKFLNNYFEQMNTIISGNNGAIDKFIGDGFMAIFDSDDPCDAINSAVQIKEHLIEYNKIRVKYNRTPLRIGIGISTGDVTIGTIGSKDRMDTTSVGNAVSTAKRIETLTKTYRLTILVSYSTVYKIHDNKDLLIREIDSIRIKGRKAPEVIYEVYNVDNEEIVRKKQESYADLLQGISYYKARLWDEAISALKRCFEIFPKDTVVLNYIRRCKFYKKNPPDNDWDGTVPSGEKFIL